MGVRVLEFTAPPTALAGYGRALADRRPARRTDSAPIPVIEARSGPAPCDRDALRRFRSVCALESDGRMPLTWPHVLATGLHLRMLLDPAFPVRVAGLIHLGHRIELLWPMAETATPTFQCRLEGGEAGARGETFRLATEAAVDGDVAWRETMEFVAPAPREAGRRRADGAAEDLPPVLAEWSAPPSVGRRYASVSGDWNPIHLFRWGARLFGLPGPIAHGMWTLARCLGRLAGPPGAGARLDVRFLRPLFLPGSARLHAGPAPDSAGTAFWLVSLPDESPKLRGRWIPAGACDEGAAHHDGLTGPTGPPAVP